MYTEKQAERWNRQSMERNISVATLIVDQINQDAPAAILLAENKWSLNNNGVYTLSIRISGDLWFFEMHCRDRLLARRLMEEETVYGIILTASKRGCLIGCRSGTQEYKCL